VKSEAEKPATGNKRPKGGRKGGTMFPKIHLEQALGYAKKLVSKTHTGPQPEKTILPGVFGNAGSDGRIRASALKQYGLLEGGADAYQATKLAKQIEAAPENERSPLLQQAFLNSKLFNQIFQTFHGDTVSKAKIEQRAKGLEVHPESASECAQLFIESAETAGLGKLSGDSINLLTVTESTQASEPPSVENSEAANDEETEKLGGPPESDESSADKGGSEPESKKHGEQSARPGIALTLTVDPSSDPDKLEKQLKLLRQYGII
jgi:hypothetical protein